MYFDVNEEIENTLKKIEYFHSPELTMKDKMNMGPSGYRDSVYQLTAYLADLYTIKSFQDKAKQS